MLDEAIEAAVRLSHRYIPARQLPDKAVSLLDTACARVAVSQHATPAEVEDCQRRIEALRTELRDHRPRGGDRHRRRRAAPAHVEGDRARKRRASSMLQKRHEEEKALVDRILEIRAKLRARPRSPRDAANGTTAPTRERRRGGASAPAR